MNSTTRTSRNKPCWTEECKCINDNISEWFCPSNWHNESFVCIVSCDEAVYFSEICRFEFLQIRYFKKRQQTWMSVAFEKSGHIELHLNGKAKLSQYAMRANLEMSLRKVSCWVVTAPIVSIVYFEWIPRTDWKRTNKESIAFRMVNERLRENLRSFALYMQWDAWVASRLYSWPHAGV